MGGLLAMVTKRERQPTVAKTLEEGIAEGGKVLWTEPEPDFKKRRSERKLGLGLAGGGFLSLPVFFIGILVLYAVNATRQIPPLTYVSLAAGILLFTAFPAWLGFVLVREGFGVIPTIKPRVFFERGITVGEGTRPYYPFSEVVAVEADQGERFKTPFVLVTFQGGEFLRISKGPFREAIEVADFDAVMRVLATLKPEPRGAPVAWDAGAVTIVEGMRSLRAPARAMFESMARQKGRATIDEAFLQANWKQMQSAYPFEHVPAWRQFNRQLKLAQKAGVEP